MSIGIVLLFITVILIYGYIYKIPIICYGCETQEGLSALFFQCVIDTSKDSEMCRISTSIENASSEVGKIGGKITGAIRHEFGKLPATIQVAYDNVMKVITDIITFIKTNMEFMGQKIGGFVNDAYEKAKKAIITTWEEFYHVLIDPIVNFIDFAVIQPIKKAIDAVKQLQALIKKSLVGAYNQVTGQLIDLKDKLVNVIADLPKNILNFLNLVIKLINNAIKESVKAINNVVNILVDNTNNAIGIMANGIDGATGGVTEASKLVAKEIENTVNKVVTGINLATVEPLNQFMGPQEGGRQNTISNLLTNGLIKPINEATNGLAGTINKAVNPILNVTRKTVDGINTVIELKIPKVEIPEVKTEPIDLKFATVPSVKFTSGFTLIPESRLLPNVSRISIDGIQDVNVNINKISDINVGLPQPLKKVDNVTISTDYSIPKVAKKPGEQYIEIKRDPIPQKDETIGPIDERGVQQLADNIREGINVPFRIVNQKIQFIYDVTMGPIDEVVNNLNALITGIEDSIKYLFSKYLNLDYLRHVWNELKNKSKEVLNSVIKIVYDNMVKPMFVIIYDIKDRFLEMIDKALQVVIKLYTDIKESLIKLFNKVSEVIYEASKMIGKVGAFLLFFTWAQYLDKIVIPIKGIPITTKVNFALLFAVAFGYIYAKVYFIGLYDIFPYLAALVIILLLFGGYKLNNPTPDEVVVDFNVYEKLPEEIKESYKDVGPYRKVQQIEYKQPVEKLKGGQYDDNYQEFNQLA
jgi:phage-related protein